MWIDGSSQILADEVWKCVGGLLSKVVSLGSLFLNEVYSPVGPVSVEVRASSREEGRVRKFYQKWTKFLINGRFWSKRDFWYGFGFLCNVAQQAPGIEPPTFLLQSKRSNHCATELIVRLSVRCHFRQWKFAIHMFLSSFQFLSFVIDNDIDIALSHFHPNPSLCAESQKGAN